MPSRTMRVVIGALCVIAFGAAAIFLRSTEHALSSRRVALVDFDVRAREATDALSDLRAAQQAYVAPGQGSGFWMPKVDASSKAVSTSLAKLQDSATSPAAKSALDEAVATFIEFGNVDGRVRDYLKAGSQLMAADIIFTEGGEAAANAARPVEIARLGEHVAFDAFEAVARRRELTAVAGVGAFALMVIAFFSFLPTRHSTTIESTTFDTTVSAASESTSGRAADLDVRPPARTERLVEFPPRPLDEATTLSAATLGTAAQVCLEIGRVRAPEDLQALLAQAAGVLNASGVLLWLASESGEHLRPMLAFGYSPQIVARIPALARDANNATAAAFRACALQIVPSRPDVAGKGAIVVPMVSADGCVGVLAAEIRAGGEASAIVQSLAGIFAAQLAGVVASAPPVEARASVGSGL